MDDIAGIIRQHHERYDGKGYPDGLKGNEICIEARILTVADGIDAMLSDRVYRKALSYDKMIEELRENAGKQFDPRVVDVYLEHVSKYLYC